MSEDRLVTQDELDILASSMAVAQQNARGKTHAAVALYDFRDATRLSPDQTHELDNRCAVLAKVLSRTLGAYLNVPLTVTFEGLHQPTFDQYIRGLPPNPILVILSLGPYSPPAVWQVDARAALLLISTMLGGSHLDAAEPPEDLTPIEAALLTRLFNEILRTWALTWPAFAQLSPTVIRITTTVADLDVESDAQAKVHNVYYRLHIVDYAAPANLALPAAALQRLLRPLQQEATATGQPASLSLSGAISKHAAAAGVTLVAEIARLRLPVQLVSNLKPGDLLPLNQHPAHPLTITVAGTPRFHARPGHKLAHLAARITAPIPNP